MSKIASLSKIFEKYFGQTKNTKSLFIILLLGILLLVFSGSFGGSKPQESKKTAPASTEHYESIKELENRLAKTLSAMRGVGSVSVMITYGDNGQTVYAVDEKMQEKTAEAGKDRQAEEKLVLKNDAGGGQSPIAVKAVLPKVSGVLVVAQGADSDVVKADIVAAVKAVLDVKPHRVQVFCK